MDKDKNKKTSSGEMAFGMQIIFFLVIIFILWVLFGGPNRSQTKNDPFITPYTDPTTPGRTYGSTNGR